MEMKTDENVHMGVTSLTYYDSTANIRNMGEYFVVVNNVFQINPIYVLQTFKTH